MPETNKAPFIDRVIGYLSPGHALKRARSRAMLNSFPDMEAVYRGQLPTRLSTPWNTSLGFQGANNPLNRWRLTKMRDRSRDLERNNAIACGMLDRCVDNVIGPHGIRMVPQTADQDFNKRVEDLWGDWADDCDIRGYCSFAELQRLTFRAHMRDGDVGIAFVQQGNDAKLQAVMGDQIDTEYGAFSLADNLMDGIKFDSRGKPVSFNIVGYNLDGSRDATVVSARDFVFFPRLKLLNATRGEPAMAQIFTLLDQIDGYLEAVIVATRVAACNSLLIKTTNSANVFGGLNAQLNSQNGYQPIVSFEPGMVRYLKPGEDVVQVNPQQPQHNFVDFITELLRIAGIVFGMPLELVLLDFSRTNYSSARASLLQSYRAFQTMQQQFIDTVLKRIYRWRVSTWVRSGKLVVPPALRGNPDQGVNPSYWDHTWIAPGWAWVDPVKEIQAAMLEVDLGLTSLTDLAAQHGKLLTDIFARRQKELAEQKGAGIPIVHSSMTRDDAQETADIHTDQAQKMQDMGIGQPQGEGSAADGENSGKGQTPKTAAKPAAKPKSATPPDQSSADGD